MFELTKLHNWLSLAVVDFFVCCQMTTDQHQCVISLFVSVYLEQCVTCPKYELVDHSNKRKKVTDFFSLDGK